MARPKLDPSDPIDRAELAAIFRRLERLGLRLELSPEHHRMERARGAKLDEAWMREHRQGIWGEN